MSAIGILSLPVLLLSILFIFFHSRFIGHYNRIMMIDEQAKEILNHKINLIIYLTPDAENYEYQTETVEELLDACKELESKYKTESYAKEDFEELQNIDDEIAQILYERNNALCNFDDFSKTLIGKFYAKFFL